MNTEGGGPAFPGERKTGQIEYVEGIGNRPVMETTQGMSLRDYFAARALPTAWQAFNDGFFEADDWDSSNQGVAVCAYQMADAMLAARSA